MKISGFLLFGIIEIYLKRDRDWYYANRKRDYADIDVQANYIRETGIIVVVHIMKEEPSPIVYNISEARSALMYMQ